MALDENRIDDMHSIEETENTMAIPDTGINSDSDSQVSYHGSVELAELLSTCIDACRRGCEVIRNVRHLSLQSSDILDAVQYKIQDDPRSALTEADGASQKVIIECLNRCWEKEIEGGFIRIVGEEDDDHYSTDLEGERSFDTAFSEDIMSHFDNYNSPRPDFEPIERDMFDQSEGSKYEVCSNENEIIIFIDPMDGTREFVEGRLQNVQCLIGITLNGIPVAGAMGLPMVHGNHIEIAYGMITSKRNEDESTAVIPLLSGVKFFDALNPLDIHYDVSLSYSAEEDDDTLMVFSGDSKKKALKMAMSCLENSVLQRIEPGNTQEADSNEGHMHPPIRKVIAGGCGNKILSVQRHFQCLSERQNEKDSSPSSPSPSPSPSPSLPSPSSPSSSSLPPMVGAISIAPPGSSSWDTAAPTAVLLAADPKARVTDLIGHPLVYDGRHLLNDYGVVVSSGCVASRIHDNLCEGLCNDPEFREAIGVELNDVVPVECVEIEIRCS